MRIATVATGTGVYQVTIVHETPIAVRVLCQAEDCMRKIDQPTSLGVSPRGCIDHPPTTWKKAPDNA